MSSESGLWDYIRKGMKPYWRAKRIENPVGAGTPDVYFTLNPSGIMGWIELKNVLAWPKRKTTTLKINHFTPEQRLFFKVHGSAGANIRMLLRVEKTVFLIWWKDALKIGELTKEDFFDRFLFWPDRVDFDELSHFLRGGPKTKG